MEKKIDLHQIVSESAIYIFVRVVLFGCCVINCLFMIFHLLLEMLYGILKLFLKPHIPKNLLTLKNIKKNRR